MSEVIKWGQFDNEFMLMTGDKYGLVQIEHDGLVCAQIGHKIWRRAYPRKSMPYFEDYYHANWFDGVEEAKKWVEDQLKVTVPDEPALCWVIMQSDNKDEVFDGPFFTEEEARLHVLPSSRYEFTVEPWTRRKSEETNA